MNLYGALLITLISSTPATAGLFGRGVRQGELRCETVDEVDRA